MGSRLRQLRLLKVTVGLAVVAGAAMLVSSASGSAFPGTTGKLVYVVFDGSHGRSVATANADGTGQKTIDAPSAQPGDMEPRVSADGKKIVFVQVASTLSNAQLWVGNADGTGMHQVSVSGLPQGAYPLSPTFTPDGKTIVFEVDQGYAAVGIWKVPVAGGAATQLTSGDDFHPTVSPDGTKLAFVRKDTQANQTSLMIANADGSNPQPLFTSPGIIIQPDFSPDGTRIAFALAGVSSVTDIWTIPVAGGDPTNVTNGTGSSSLNPAYSPDGTKIAFTATDTSTHVTTIEEMPAGGGTTTAVITSPAGESVQLGDWGVAPKSTPHKKHHHHHRHHHKHKHK